MLKSLLRDENNQFQVIEDISAISEIVQHKDRLLWLDLEQPTFAEFRMLRDEFKFHPLAIEDAMAMHPRPKVDQYENFYLVVFYLVNADTLQPGTPAANTLQASETSVARDGGTGSKTGSVLRPGSDGRVEFHNLVRAAASKHPDDPSQMQQSGAIHGPHNDNEQVLSNSEDAVGLHPMNTGILLRELTMFMGENYLVTVHKDPIPEFSEVARRWRQNVTIIDPDGDEEPPRATVPGCRGLTGSEQQNLDAHIGKAGRSEKTSALPGTETPAATGAPAGAGSHANGTVNANNVIGNSAGVTPARSHTDQTPMLRDAKHQNGVAASGVRQTGEIGILLYSMLDTIVDAYFPVVDGVVDRVEDLEEEIFERYNQSAIESIFTLKKDLLALRKVLAPERDVLNILVRRDLPIFDQQTLLYFQDLYDHIVRITDSIDTYRDLLSSALDSFLSMQSNRLNITVQTLTSVSIMLMSVATITGWYGMNFQSMPELASRFGYPGVVLLAAIVVGIEAMFFRRRGWL